MIRMFWCPTCRAQVQSCSWSLHVTSLQKRLFSDGLKVIIDTHMRCPIDDFLLGDGNKCLFTQTRYWQQMKGTIPLQHALLNQWVCWGDILERVWGVTIGSRVKGDFKGMGGSGSLITTKPIQHDWWITHLYCWITLTNDINQVHPRQSPFPSDCLWLT